MACTETCSPCSTPGLARTFRPRSVADRYAWAACPSPEARFGSAGMPAHQPGCGTKPRHEQRLVRSRMGNPKPRSSEGNLPQRDGPPCPGVRDPGVSPSRRYSPHRAARRVCRWVWRGGLLVGLPGTASPPPQRSPVRLISVRRFASVCAPMCVRVWSCLAFSMPVTPSPPRSRSPHPRRHAGRPARTGPGPPSPAPASHAAGLPLRSSKKRGVQRSFCPP